MNKIFRCEHNGRLVKSALFLSLGCALTIGVGLSFAPAMKAEVTPAEMIQTKLPQSKNLATASKSEILSAICAAIAKSPNDAPEIVRTAAGARKDLAADITEQSIQCLHHHATGCDLVGQTVAAAISANPNEAAKINELALKEAPDCSSSIENAGTPAEGPNANPPNLNPPPGSLGGGGGVKADPKNSVTVCDNGQNVQISSSSQPNYLAGHPGSRLGACQTSPGVNK